MKESPGFTNMPAIFFMRNHRKNVGLFVIPGEVSFEMVVNLGNLSRFSYIDNVIFLTISNETRLSRYPYSV